MAAAAHNADRVLAWRGYVDRLRVLVGRCPLGACTECPPIGHAQRWGVHGSRNGAVPLHECDVDGEFAVALDEFLGAIQGIHQPVALPVGSTGDVFLG